MSNAARLSGNPGSLFESDNVISTGSEYLDLFIVPVILADTKYGSIECELTFGIFDTQRHVRQPACF